MKRSLRMLATPAILCATSLALAKPDLPPEPQKALNEVCWMRDKGEDVGYGSKAVDLDGDGKPEYVVEVLGQRDKDVPYCVKDVLTQGEKGWVEAMTFKCCEIKLTAAKGKHGGSIVCKDIDAERAPLFAWKGAWPVDAKTGTRAEVEAAARQGAKLYREKSYKAAADILCAPRMHVCGATNPDYENGCALARIGLKDYIPADITIDNAIEQHPDAAALYITRATLAELMQEPNRADTSRLKRAQDSYEKFLALSPHAPERAAVQKRLDAVKAKLTPK